MPPQRRKIQTRFANDPSSPIAWGKPAESRFCPKSARLCASAWVISPDAGNIGFMANNSEEDKQSEGEGATATGMVEAVTQNVELIVERVMDTAEDAVVAVQ